MPDTLPCSFLWEDGIFETMRSEGKKIVALDLHLNRLFESAHSLGLSLGYTKQTLKRLLNREVALRPYPDASLRIAFIREGKTSRLFLIVKEITRYRLDFYERGVSVRTSPTRRNLISSLDAQMKVRDYLNGLLSTLDEPSPGKTIEEIYLDSQGYVTEGRISNIFMVKEGTLFTPPVFLGVLRGITRDQAIAEARRLKIAVLEEPFTRCNLYGADEVFLTNTSMGAMPVTSVDGRPIGEGKVGSLTKKMIRSLRPRRF